MDQATRETLFSSGSGEYETPDWVYNPLNEHFKFTLDAAASHENHKVNWYLTTEGLYVKNFSTPYRMDERDGLSYPWHEQPRKAGWERPSVWLNPPYGRGVEDWVRKCTMEAPHCEVIVALLPARTDTSWFHRWVAPRATVYFLMRRITFVGAKSNAPFPSIIAVYKTEPPWAGNKLRTLDLKSGGFNA